MNLQIECGILGELEKCLNTIPVHVNDLDWRSPMPSETVQDSIPTRKPKRKYTLPLKTKEEKLETRRAYRAANRERIRQSHRQWAKANPEKRTASAKRYREANLHKIKEKSKAYRESQQGRDYNLKYTNVYYSDPVNRMRLLASGAILRAKKQGREFDDGLVDLLISAPPTVCACCGIEFDYSMRRGNRDKSPSLDRFDNSRGYTIANVVVICMRCNEVKGDASLVELLTVVAYMSASRDVVSAMVILAAGRAAQIVTNGDVQCVI